MIPGTGKLRLRWAEATLDSIQLHEPRWIPGAVDPGLEVSEESSDLETLLESESSNEESLDLLSGVELDLSDEESVDLLSGVELELLDKECLGLQSAGSYLLWLSCWFLLLVSASLSTFCSSSVLQ